MIGNNGGIPLVVPMYYNAISGQFKPGTTNPGGNSQYVTLVADNGTAVEVVSPADNINPSLALSTASILYGYDGATYDRIRSGLNNADGQASVATGVLSNNSHLMLFNGTTFDRQRNNFDLTVLTSAARTASINSADFVNYNSRGVIIIINVTAIAATPSITVSIDGFDTTSGMYYSLLTSAAITTVSTTILSIAPGLNTVVNSRLSELLPRTWRVSVVNADADSITYSIGASLVV